MTDRIYCSKCYYNRVRFVGEVCPTCQNKVQHTDEDKRIQEILKQQETKPRSWRDVFGFGRKGK